MKFIRSVFEAKFKTPKNSQTSKTVVFWVATLFVLQIALQQLWKKACRSFWFRINSKVQIKEIDFQENWKKIQKLFKKIWYIEGHISSFNKTWVEFSHKPSVLSIEPDTSDVAGLFCERSKAAQVEKTEKRLGEYSSTQGSERVSIRALFWKQLT